MARQWGKRTHNQSGLCIVTEATDGASTCRQMPHTPHTPDTLLLASMMDRPDWPDLERLRSKCLFVTCLCFLLFLKTTWITYWFNMGVWKDVYFYSIFWEKKHITFTLAYWCGMHFATDHCLLVPLKQDQMKPCLLWSDVCDAKNVPFFLKVRLLL